MKFAAVLAVLDEVELLEDCIAHLRAIGVERIFAHDVGCRDGSEAILARHEGPDFQVVQHSGLDPDASAWNRLHERLAHESGADWVLFLDADEFWLPASGHLRDCRALASADVLTVPRYNVLLGPRGPWIDGASTPFAAQAMQMVVRAPERFRERLSAGEVVPWSRGVPLPKIMVRPRAIGELGEAEHTVQPPPGAVLRECVPDDLLIAHLPFSTLPRFTRKIENLREVFTVHDEHWGENGAWHWRRWIGLRDDADVRGEFARQATSAHGLAALRAAGIVRSDRELFGRA